MTEQNQIIKSIKSFSNNNSINSSNSNTSSSKSNSILKETDSELGEGEDSVSISTSNENIQQTQSSSPSKIELDNLIKSPVRIPLGDRRRTYEDETIKSNSNHSQSVSNFDSSEIESNSNKDTIPNEFKLRRRSSSVELGGSGGNAAVKDDDKISGNPNDTVDQTPVRPSLSAPNSSRNTVVNRSMRATNSNDTQSYPNTPSIHHATPRMPISTSSSFQPHYGRSNSYGGTSSNNNNNGSHHHHHDENFPPNQNPYQNQQNTTQYYSTGYPAPIRGVGGGLSPLNTNIELIPPPPQPPFFQNSHPPSTLPSGYTFSPPVPYPTLYPSPNLPLHPLLPVDQINYTNMSTPITPSEETLALGQVRIGSSGVLISEGNDNNVDDSNLNNSNIVESADIVYDSDGEPSTNDLGEIVAKKSSLSQIGENLPIQINNNNSGLDSVVNNYFNGGNENSYPQQQQPGYNLQSPPLQSLQQQPPSYPIPILQPYLSPPPPPPPSVLHPRINNQQNVYNNNQQNHQSNNNNNGGNYNQFQQPQFQPHPGQNPYQFPVPNGFGFQPPYPPPSSFPLPISMIQQQQQNFEMNQFGFHQQQQNQQNQNQGAGSNNSYGSMYSPMSPQSNNSNNYPMNFNQSLNMNSPNMMNNLHPQSQLLPPNEPYRYHSHSPIPPHNLQSTSPLPSNSPLTSLTPTPSASTNASGVGIYSPPLSEGLTRGSLAQAKFYDEIYGSNNTTNTSTSSNIGGGGGGNYNNPGYINSNENGMLGMGENGAGSFRKNGLGGLGRGLPRPPVHSPHALWVGNVPSDATHDELWNFFTSRPPPSESNMKSLNQTNLNSVDLNQCGVESIHLINRSNCAFVNYASDIHLQHSINVSHGISLRPLDPKCKELVCRVRKREDDTKSGVGAQRSGGMHHAYLASKQFQNQHPNQQQYQQNYHQPHANFNQFNPHSNGRLGGGGGESNGNNFNNSIPLRHFNSNYHPNNNNSGLQNQSILRNRTSFEASPSLASTNSSFLGKYFAKRFFILKSMNEEDLDLSVKTGLWATQSHNEPVLDQAFRSCKEGVFLIFGANKAGEWYGYAKMTGPVSVSGRHPSYRSDRPSTTSSNSLSSPFSNSSTAGGLTTGSSSNGRVQTIPEDSPADFITAKPINPTKSSTGRPLIFSPSESRLVDASPLVMTPATTRLPSTTTSTISRSKLVTQAATALRSSSAPIDEMTESIADNLHIPEDKRADSLDPKILLELESGNSSTSRTNTPSEEKEERKDAFTELGDDGVYRRDTLPTAEERNARLEKMSEDPDKDGSSSSIETQPFKVEWIKVLRLPFYHTRHIKNVFNAGKECKVSRDGTEVDPVAGEQLIEAFYKFDGTQPPESSFSKSSISSRLISSTTSNLSSIARFRENESSQSFNSTSTVS